MTVGQQFFSLHGTGLSNVPGIVSYDLRLTSSEIRRCLSIVCLRALETNGIRISRLPNQTLPSNIQKPCKRKSRSQYGSKKYTYLMINLLTLDLPTLPPLPPDDLLRFLQLALLLGFSAPGKSP